MELLIDLLNFLLLAAHDEIAVRTEDVVNDENHDKNDQQIPPVMMNKISCAFFHVLLQPFRIQSEATLLSFSVAAALSAST